MKPQLLVDIDNAITADLGMEIQATADAVIVDACSAWMSSQDEYKNMEVKSYLVYRQVRIDTSMAPIGDKGYRVRMVTKSN